MTVAELWELVMPLMRTRMRPPVMHWVPSKGYWGSIPSWDPECRISDKHAALIWQGYLWPLVAQAGVTIEPAENSDGWFYIWGDLDDEDPRRCSNRFATALECVVAAALAVLERERSGA